MNWQSAVERTVVGLGYDLVDADKSAGGLLRVFIDHPAASVPDGEERFITVDDCEKVTRQLQHVLEVDGVEYARLEVSSPGLDRPLKKTADYERFVGQQVELTLKTPFQGRKKFSGELRAGADGWRLALVDAVSDRRAKRAAAAAAAKAVIAADADAAASETVLDFSLDEVREARLVPTVDFKGRRFAASDDGAAAGRRDDGLDGGRVQ